MNAEAGYRGRVAGQQRAEIRQSDRPDQPSTVISRMTTLSGPFRLCSSGKRPLFDAMASVWSGSAGSAFQRKAADRTQVRKRPAHGGARNQYSSASIMVNTRVVL